MEFNGNTFPSEKLSFQIVLKNLKDFLKNPPKNEFSKISILEFKDNVPFLNKFEIFNWDGLIEIEEKLKIFNIDKEVQIKYHNSFKYLKYAKDLIKNKDFEAAKTYLSLIKIIDPKSQEAKESDDLMKQIYKEELKVEIEDLNTKAREFEKAGKFEEVLKFYEKMLQKFQENVEFFPIFQENSSEIENKILEIKENLKNVERKKREEEAIQEKMRKEKEEEEAKRIAKKKKR